MYWWCAGIMMGLIFSPVAGAKTRVNVGYGGGMPNDIYGGRLAIQDDWLKSWNFGKRLTLTGYWDYSIAYWHTHGHLCPGEQDNMTILGLAPVLRLQSRALQSITPYFEASVGLAWMSHSTLGQRNLGANFAFQDLVGFGFTFGQQQQFEISYHYLHYSNAGLFAPNQGIDVNYLVSIQYTIH